MADGCYENNPMIPLSDKEEAILHLMKEVSKLKTEIIDLKEENARLRWTIMEQD